MEPSALQASMRLPTSRRVERCRGRPSQLMAHPAGQTGGATAPQRAERSPCCLSSPGVRHYYASLASGRSGLAASSPFQTSVGISPTLGTRRRRRRARPGAAQRHCCSRGTAEVWGRVSRAQQWARSAVGVHTPAGPGPGGPALCAAVPSQSGTERRPGP
eukprot:scaffold96600_cov63-Phaeocystis_antarctica.AAC.4